MLKEFTMVSLRSIQKNSVDLKRVLSIGEALRNLANELENIFPERRQLIDQIIFGLLTREHVLIFGRFGTGKSDLINTLVESITGSKIFPVSLTKFTQESALFGVPDPKKFRDEGDLIYDPAKGILSFDFADLDEIFDSNAPLLRTLLGVLNERQWKRGRQVIKAALLSAFASTNGIPDEEVRKSPELGAVVDRFLFRTRVEYLKAASSRRKMYKKYLTGEKPTIKIPLDDIKYISSIVVDANQITDDYFIEVYDLVIEAYKDAVKSKGEVISDRRACKLLQLIEANALLYGRFEVDFEDILAIRHGLCNGDPDNLAVFRKVAEPIIQKAKATQAQSIDDVQLKLLAQLEKNIPTIPVNCPDGELIKLRRTLQKVRGEIDAVKPQLDSSSDKKRAMQERVKDLLEKVQALIDAVK